MRKTGVATLALVALLAGCGTNGKASSSPTTDWVGEWAKNVMHDHNKAHVDKYRPIAKKICKGLRSGDITRNDLYQMPLHEQDSLSGAQVLSFEYVAIKQYCPDQMDKVPIEHSTPATPIL